MPTVRFTAALQRFFPDLQTAQVEGQTVAELLQKMDEQHPGLAAYIVDEHGALRQHVNIYIGEHLLQDRKELQDEVQSTDEVLIFQALSGG